MAVRRRVLLGVAGLALALAALPVLAEDVTPNRGELVWGTLIQPTDRYDHRVFGDLPSFGAMKLQINVCLGCAALRLRDLVVTLPPTRVFEDTDVRIHDLDGDGFAEAVVVETDIARGATLAVYDATGKRAATAPVGQTHRWLAPAGIGDFDGDGGLEIAYVDRPHLARELVFVRYAQGALTEVARSPGFTNHRFGAPMITGGVQTCNGVDAVILVSADWSRIVSVRLEGGQVMATDLGPYGTDADLRAAMDCP